MDRTLLAASIFAFLQLEMLRKQIMQQLAIRKTNIRTDRRAEMR